MVARRRAKHAPTGEAMGERSSPLRDKDRRRGCRVTYGRPPGCIPEWNPNTGVWGTATGRSAGMRSTPLPGRRRASAARPYGMRIDGGAVGMTCARPPELHSRMEPKYRGVGNGRWSFRGRAEYAPTGETTGERSSPLRDEDRRRGCRGDLWSPAWVCYRNGKPKSEQN